MAEAALEVGMGAMVEVVNKILLSFSCHVFEINFVPMP